jgi:hypothetical protein
LYLENEKTSIRIFFVYDFFSSPITGFFFKIGDFLSPLIAQTQATFDVYLSNLTNTYEVKDNISAIVVYF